MHQIGAKFPGIERATISVHCHDDLGLAVANSPAGVLNTSGTEAMGEVTVQLEEGGRRVKGRGVSTDVIEASARAYIDGLNKLA